MQSASVTFTLPLLFISISLNPASVVIFTASIPSPSSTSISAASPNILYKKKKNQAGLIIPVEITVYADRSFSFITKTPPAAVLLKKAAGIERASGEPNRKKVAKVPASKVKAIAEEKMQDLNAASLEAAISMIEGTARSMGIEVVED